MLKSLFDVKYFHLCNKNYNPISVLDAYNPSIFYTNTFVDSVMSDENGTTITLLQ